MTARGSWWRPARPEDPRPGTLTLSAETLDLELDSNFNEPGAPHGVPQPLFATVAVPVLFGTALDGQKYSVLDVSYRKAGLFSSGPMRHTALAILVGNHLEGAALTFRQATARYSHLLDWTGWLGLSSDPEGSTPEHPKKIYTSTVRRNSFQIPGGTFHLDEARDHTYDGRYLTIRQEAEVVVDFALDQGWRACLEQFITPVNDLLSFAAMSASTIQRVWLQPAVEANPSAVQLLYRSLDLSRPRPDRHIHPTEMLFTLPEAQRFTADIIAAWMALREIRRSVLTQLLSSAYAPFEWAENTFLAAARASDALNGQLFTRQPFSKDEIGWLAAGIDAIHAGAAMEPTRLAELKEYAKRVVRGSNYHPQKNKLGQLVAYAAVVGGQIEARDPQFIKHIVDVRNALTHPNLHSIDDSIQRYWLEQALRWLIREALLRELHMSAAQIAVATSHNSQFNSMLSFLVSPPQPDPADTAS